MNKLETIVLENGLTVYLYQDSRRHSTFFQFITRFGGVHKDFHFKGKDYHMQDGVAHILEHYLAEYSDSGNFLEELGKKQMNTNASTHYQMTRFYFDAVENVTFGIKTLLNGLYHVSFQEESLEKIKKPIYQEIRAKSDSRFYHSNILSLQNLFHNISFRSIGGSLDDVKQTTVDDLKLCYEAFYQPKNQFIVIAGNFDKKEVMQVIQDFYKDIFTSYHEVKLLDYHEPVNVCKVEDTLEFRTPLDYVEFSFKIDIHSLSSEERLNLNFYLGCFYNQFFGPTSALYKELTDKKVISSGIGVSDTTIDNYLIINIGAYTYSKEIFQKKVLNTIRSLPCFSEELFSLDQKSAIVRLILRDENIINMILPFVENIITYDYPYLDSVQDIKKLNYHDFKNTIQNIDFSNYVIIYIHESKKEFLS